MHLRGGLVLKDFEVEKAVRRVGIGQDMKLEDAWLIFDGGPRFTDRCLPERADVLRLDVDSAEDRIHAVSLRSHRPIIGQRQVRL